MEAPESRHVYYRHCSGLTTALVVIAIGILFLLYNLGVGLPFMAYHNWWALFILIGAIGPLSYAVQRYRNQGKMDGGVLHSLVSAAAIVTVALFFLLELDWQTWWPLFIVYGGLWMLANHWLRNPGISSS
ncbi:MAG: LiaF transmembrane domain-containing protein [Gammaproteobacteria bacterium]